ncbi:MAG: copper ion binding protein, partial [Dehalococcoidia bacterium]|nr:copper ion binding protein [Dehalococcoidia bacterium]
MANKRVDLPVQGMHCASCVATIQEGLSQVPGVAQANVNLATEKATIYMDTGAADLRTLISTVKDLGYEVPVEKITLPIEGMTCASCVARVEGALKEVDGVLSASVNLATERATVEFVPGQAGVADLRRAVEGAGYGVGELAAGADMVDRERLARQAEIRTLGIKVVVGAVLSIPVFLGGFPEWFPWMPAILQNDYVLWALATPVQFWVGWRFYKGAWAGLKHLTTGMNTLIAVGTSAAYFYTAASILFHEFFESHDLGHAMYFDTAAIIITLILLGRFLEARARGRTSEAIRRLMKLQPRRARVLRDGQEVEIAAEEVQIDDLLLVRPGEAVPVD